jgi:hypothetical protein
MARARRVLVLLAVLPVVVVTTSLARPVTRATTGGTPSCLDLGPPLADIDQLNRFWRAEGVARV